MLDDDRADGFVKHREAVAQGVRRVGDDHAVSDMREPVAGDLDHAPARARETWIEAGNADGGHVLLARIACASVGQGVGASNCIYAADSFSISASLNS